MKRIGMIKIKDVLRHRHEFELPRAQIAAAVGVSTGTVSHVLARAEAAGLSWLLPSGLDDEALRVRLYSAPDQYSDRTQPDWDTIVEALTAPRKRRRALVRRRQLRVEYRDQAPAQGGKPIQRHVQDRSKCHRPAARPAGEQGGISTGYSTRRSAAAKHSQPRRPVAAMQQPGNRDVLAVWSKLCAAFSRRIPFLPWGAETVPTFINFGNDQVTWHRKHIRAWKRAGTILGREEKAVLYALREISRENVAILRGAFKSNVWMLTTVAAFAVFAYNTVRALRFDELSPSEFCSLLTQYPTILWPILAGLGLMLLLALTSWIRMRQGIELNACVELAVTLRNAVDGATRQFDGRAAGESGRWR